MIDCVTHAAVLDHLRTLGFEIIESTNEDAPDAAGLPPPSLDVFWCD